MSVYVHNNSNGLQLVTAVVKSWKAKCINQVTYSTTHQYFMDVHGLVTKHIVNVCQRRQK